MLGRWNVGRRNWARSASSPPLVLLPQLAFRSHTRRYPHLLSQPWSWSILGARVCGPQCCLRRIWGAECNWYRRSPLMVEGNRTNETLAVLLRIYPQNATLSCVRRTCLNSASSRCTYTKCLCELENLHRIIMCQLLQELRYIYSGIGRYLLGKGLFGHGVWWSVWERGRMRNVTDDSVTCHTILLPWVWKYRHFPSCDIT